MILIVGLGNPGTKYINNRHNVGHMFIDYLDETRNSKLEARNKFKILKTNSFMNNSGAFVKKQISNFKFRISNLIVVHDDLDIPLGKFKIQKGSGPKLHNGILSIEKALDRKDFWRIRIGVENRGGDNKISGEDYVLQNFTGEEKQSLQNDVFPNIQTGLSDIIEL